MANRYRANPAFTRQLARQPKLRNAISDAAEEVASRAEAIAEGAGAPWMPRKGSGRRTFVVDKGGDTVRVVNIDHAGHLQEWGSKNNPPHSPLRRAVRAAGLRFDAKPK
jgi:hypothetical protein